MPPDRTPDRIAVDLKMASSGVPDGYASFKGYLAAEHDGLQRLYSDDTFQRWIAVAASDIVGRINVPPNETDARSVVYIRREAKVIACHVSYAHEVEVEVEVEDKSFESAASGLPGHPPWRS
jgi:hypothetical protein